MIREYIQQERKEAFSIFILSQAMVHGSKHVPLSETIIDLGSF